MKQRTTKTKKAPRLAFEEQIANLATRVVDTAADASAKVGFTFHFFTWAYLSRLGFSVVVLLLTGFLNALASAHAGWRNPNIVILNSTGQDSGLRILPDLGHDFVTMLTQFLFGTEYMEWAALPDHFVKVFYPLTFCFILIHPKRFAIARRLCAVYGLINALRTITVSVTSLPDPSPYCQAQFTNPTGWYKSQARWPLVFYRAVKLVLEPATHHTCGDMVFSGHSVVLLMCCMVFQEYCNPAVFARERRSSARVVRVCFLIRFSIATATAIGLVAIVGTRLHYTLDVLTATYITILLWDTYHYHMKSNERGNKFDWALKILRWLEAEEVAAIDAAALSRWTGRGLLKVVKS